MFHFYDPRALKVNACPSPSISDKTVSATSYIINKCRNNIERNFLDADMMHSLACYLQWLLVVSHPENTKQTIPLLPQKNWMQSMLKAVKKGASGTVNLSEALSRRLPLAIKSVNPEQSLSGIIDFVHEYMVAIYGTNELRRLCPNFCYTFAMYHHDYVVRLAMEKIEGMRIADYLRSYHTRPINATDCNEFFKLFTQIVLSLEQAQETLFFTHFDLHGENVIVRPVANTLPYLEYVCFDQVYQIPNVTNIATIIDFGHSTVRYSKGFIGKWGERSFPEYGMYPFYIPGADIFKLVCYLWLNLYFRKYFPPNTMGYVYQAFFRFVLLELYQIQTESASAPYYIDPKSLSDSFYNGTRLGTIYSSPYDLLRLMDDRKQDILNVLHLPQYPWKKMTLSPSFTFYKTLTYHKDETYRCFQDLFCTSISPLEKDLFHSTYQKEDVTISKEEIDSILKRKIPLLGFSHLHEIHNFLKPVDLWERFIKHMNYRFTQIRKCHQSCDSSFYRLLYYYRAYITLLGCKSYYEQFYKLIY